MSGKAKGGFATAVQLEELVARVEALTARVDGLGAEVARKDMDFPPRAEMGAMAARITKLSARIDSIATVTVRVDEAGLGGPLPRLELPADALPPGVAPGVASEPLHGALSLVEGSRVAVLMELGGVWLGTVLRRTAAGIEVDLGRAGTMVVPADRVSPVPEGWR